MSDDKPTGTPGEELTLEGRLQRLEAIVAALESGELELDGALGLFEEGVAHLRASEELLSQAELRVEELLSDGEDPQVRPLEGNGGS